MWKMRQFVSEMNEYLEWDYFRKCMSMYSDIWKYDNIKWNNGFMCGL